MLFSSECRKGETNIVVRCPGGMAWPYGQRNSCHLMAMSCFMTWLFWNWLNYFMENEQSLSSIRHLRKPLFKLCKKIQTAEAFSDGNLKQKSVWSIFIPSRMWVRFQDLARTFKLSWCENSLGCGNLKRSCFEKIKNWRQRSSLDTNLI